MEKLFGILGIIVFVGLAYLMSKDKKNINWKGVGVLFASQIVITGLFITTPLWKVVEFIANCFNWLLSQATYGIDFVFGGLANDGMFNFFVGALLPIVFLSAFIGALLHFGILQKFVLITTKPLAKLLNIDETVVLCSVVNMFMGMSESLLFTRSKLKNAKDNVILGTNVLGFCAISTTVISMYVAFGGSIEYIIVSIPLSMISGLTLLQIVAPTTYNNEEVEVEVDDIGINVFDTMIRYANTGFKAVINIAISLVVFVSVVYLINNFIGIFVPSVTLQGIISILFMPFALFMGIPFEEIGIASELLATRLVFNEAVAFSSPLISELSTKTLYMMSVGLAGFIGISSPFIMVSAYSILAPNKVAYVLKNGLYALIVANLVTMMGALIVGLFL